MLSSQNSVVANETIMDLAKDGSLTKWVKDDAKDSKLYNTIQQRLVIIQKLDNKIVSTKSRYPYCCIIPAKDFDGISTEQRIAYTTEYKLIIAHQDSLYYTIFTAKYSKIKLLHQIAIKDRIYFPSTRATRHNFPEPTVCGI